MTTSQSPKSQKKRRTTKVIHLVDDTKPGGVMRFLDHLTSTANQAEVGLGKQEVLVVKRGTWLAPQLDVDVIVSHLSVSWINLPFFLSLRNRHTNAHIIHVEHSYSAGFMEHNVTNQKRFHTLLSTTYALCNRVIAVSEGQAEWMRDNALLSPNRLNVITPRVDLSPMLNLAPSEARLPYPDQPITIGVIGRMHAQKGLDLLIDAFRLLDMPNLKLHITGGGPEEARLRVRAQGNTNIQFATYTDNPTAAYAACDIIAIPSRWEPFGLVALEARAAAKPLMVTLIDGLTEQADSGYAISAPKATVEDWATALSSLNGANLSAMGRRARLSVMPEDMRYIQQWQRAMTPRGRNTSSSQNRKVTNKLTSHTPA
ncbi:MAG: glycosyltransferase family 4 protein [Parvibaculaceae bacterium]|nr:glycosyltransferase family 4 protein [Parvibaculaceae bacterium]